MVAPKSKKVARREDLIDLVDMHIDLFDDSGLEAVTARVQLVYNKAKRRFEMSVTVVSGNGDSMAAGRTKTKKIGTRRLIRALKKRD